MQKFVYLPSDDRYACDLEQANMQIFMYACMYVYVCVRQCGRFEHGMCA